MEPIPLGDRVGQLTGVRMTGFWMNLDIEVVGEHFLGIAAAEDREEKNDDGDDIILVEERNKGT